MAKVQRPESGPSVDFAEGVEAAETTPGRRERNKREKQQRIYEAAAELFGERGFAAVTTQQVAARADVAEGTLFRYAASKAELLLMVRNREYAEALAAAESALPPSQDAGARLATLLAPIVYSGRLNDENTANYQLAVMFGDAAGRYRREALELIDRVRARIAEVLTEAWVLQHPEPLHKTGVAQQAPDASAAARAIFAALQMETAVAVLEAVPVDQQLANILDQVDVIARGYLQPRRPTRPRAHNAQHE